jgi:hypothetical protein
MGLSVQIDSGSGKDFEPVTEMIQPAVLADIVDKGMVPNKFGKVGADGKIPLQHKCYFVWLVAETDTEDRNKRVFQSFTVSLNEKATLRKFLGTLGIKEFPSAFDLDTLIGTKRMLVLSEEDGREGGKPFIKITATMALKKGQTAPEIPADFVRKQDQA